MSEQKRASHVVIGPDDPRAGRKEWTHLHQHVGVGSAPDLTGCEAVVIAPASNDATGASILAWGAALRLAAQNSARVWVCVPVWDARHSPAPVERASRAATNALIAQILGLRVTNATAFDVAAASELTNYVVWMPPQIDLLGITPIEANPGPFLRVDRHAIASADHANVEMCRNAFATRPERLHTPRWRFDRGIIELRGAQRTRDITLSLDAAFTDHEAHPEARARFEPLTELTEIVGFDTVDTEPEAGRPALTASEDAMGKALMALKRDPFMTVEDLTELAGVARTTYYKPSWRKVKEAREFLQDAARTDRPRGYRDASTGNIEATDDLRRRGTTRRRSSTDDG